MSSFGEYGALDAKAAITTVMTIDPATNKITYSIEKFYNSEVHAPETRENFSGPHMTLTTDAYKLQPLNAFINDGYGRVTPPLRLEKDPGCGISVHELCG